MSLTPLPLSLFERGRGVPYPESDYETGGFIAMRTNLLNLIHTAAREGQSYASGGKWRATFEFDPIWPHSPSVHVWHHSTHMFTVHLNGDDTWGQVEPVDPGYGSTSDRCGVRRILTGIGNPLGYKDLYA